MPKTERRSAQISPSVTPASTAATMGGTRFAVPRAALDPQLAALGPLAPLLAGIDVAGNDGTPLEVNLLPPDPEGTDGAE